MNLVHSQKQLECHQHILKFKFVKIMFIKPLIFVKNHEDARTGAKGEPMATAWI